MVLESLIYNSAVIGQDFWVMTSQTTLLSLPFEEDCLVIYCQEVVPSNNVYMEFYSLMAWWYPWNLYKMILFYCKKCTLNRKKNHAGKEHFFFYHNGNYYTIT